MDNDSLTVALTGATGFVGGHTLAALLARGHTVRVLARDPEALEAPPGPEKALVRVKGDLFDPESLDRLVEGTDAVVHLVGIIDERGGRSFEAVHVEGTRLLLAAAQSAGVRRWVQMSALGSRDGAVSRYHRSKFEAETQVRDSGLDWTILRPSIIHGPDGEFMQMVRGFWTGLFPPFVPYFGAGPLGRGGAGRLQPVWVEDVARVAAEAITNDRAIGEVYPMGGPEAMSWPAFYRACRAHLPKAMNKPVLPVPVWYANLVAGWAGVPFNRDQVVMSQEDSVCERAKFEKHFEFEAAPFAATFAEYAGRL